MDDFRTYQGAVFAPWLLSGDNAKVLGKLDHDKCLKD